MQATEYFNVGRWANFGRRLVLVRSHITIAAQSGAATTANLSRLLIDRITNSD